jgi:hypothetical protein
VAQYARADFLVSNTVAGPNRLEGGRKTVLFVFREAKRLICCL